MASVNIPVAGKFYKWILGLALKFRKHWNTEHLTLNIVTQSLAKRAERKIVLLQQQTR